jgi:ribosomal protein S18 acetylase RimI-like enzyme
VLTAAPVEVAVAGTAAELDAVRDLMRAFLAWHIARHERDRDLIDRYFSGGGFEAELAGLPGKYAPPGGRLLLAIGDGEPAGCVALRRLDGDVCEMKRMYVSERFRGRGVGVALTERLLAAARSLGYRRMLLDTSIRQAEALGLYERFGFTRIDPYYELPDDLRDWLVFLELEL